MYKKSDRNTGLEALSEVHTLFFDPKLLISLSFKFSLCNGGSDKLIFKNYKHNFEYIKLNKPKITEILYQ